MGCRRFCQRDLYLSAKSQKPKAKCCIHREACPAEIKGAGMKYYNFIVTILFISLNYSAAQNFGKWEILNAGEVCHSIDFINDKVGWMAGDGMLLKTEDGGDTWKSLQIDPEWNIYTVDFVNENIGWCCGGYDDEIKQKFYHIFIKSLDGGQTWTIQRNVEGSPYRADKNIFAVNDSVVYIDFLKTTDGGKNWIDVSPDEEYFRISSIWFFNPDSGLAAGCERINDTYRAAILKTYNGGRSWKKRTDSNFREFSNLQFFNNSIGYFSAVDTDNDYMCFTSDACNSWAVKEEGVDCFDLFDQDKIVAIICDTLGIPSVRVSSDGGNTWELKNTLLGGRVYYELNFYYSNLWYLTSVIGGGMGGIIGEIVYKTKDCGNNWIVQQIKYPLKGLYFIDKNTGFVSGGVSEWHGGCGNLFKTYDGGRTWITSFQSSDEVRSVLFLDPNIGYILSTHSSAGTQTNIYKTTDSGSTWDEIYADESDSAGFYFAANDMYFINKNMGWIAGTGFHNDTSGAAFLNTMDGGESWGLSWILLSPDDQNNGLNSLHFVDSTLGWAVGESGLIVKYTEQNKWQVQSKVTDLPLKDVFFSDADHGWAAGGYLNEQDFQSILLKTNDGGITWQGKKNHNYLINDMFFRDSLNGFAAANDTSSQIDWIGSWQPARGRGALLKTNDGGESWFIVADDLPARLTAVHFKDGYGWAIGENGLVLRTEDGSTWVDQSSGKTYPHAFKLSQNYPNPFNNSTMINYQLPQTCDVELSIYNLLGQKVSTLVSEKQPAGSYEAAWNATGFASGIYIYQLKAVGQEQNAVFTKKLVLLK